MIGVPQKSSSVVRTRCLLVSLLALILSRACDASIDDCAGKPEICALNEYCQLTIDPDDPSAVTGRCVTIASSPDCYRFPGTCDEDQWCQLSDRESWAETDNTTRGRCVSYQQLCHSCSRAASEPSAAMGLPILADALLNALAVVTPSRSLLGVSDSDTLVDWLTG